MTPIEEARQAVVQAAQNLAFHPWQGTPEELTVALDGACRTLVQLLDATPGPR